MPKSKVKPETPMASPAAKQPAARKTPVRKVAAKPPGKTAPQPPVTAVAELPLAEKNIKQKLVRDSFTMPRADFDVIQGLKDRALNFKRPAKKSELLRAGLHALQALTDAKLKIALDGLAPLKAGRPKKSV